MSDLEAFLRFGLDAQIQYFGDVGLAPQKNSLAKASTKDWKIEARVLSAETDKRILAYTVTTPEGLLAFETESDQKNNLDDRISGQAAGKH